MNTAEAEIRFLERLYELPSEEEQEQMNHDPNLKASAELVVAEIELAEKRAGKDGLHCFFCGFDVPTSDCRCPYPESFGCHGKRTCADCEKAMIAVASHIRAIFNAKVSHRVSSIRRRFYFQLTSAARAIGNADVQGLTELHFCLAKADLFDDPKNIFEARLLRAFRRCRFVRFRALADQLDRESYDAMLNGIIRTGLLGKVSSFLPRCERDMSPEEEQFYTEFSKSPQKEN